MDTNKNPKNTNTGLARYVIYNLNQGFVCEGEPQSLDEVEAEVQEEIAGGMYEADDVVICRLVPVRTVVMIPKFASVTTDNLENC